MKKLLSVLLVFVMLLSLAPVTLASEEAELPQSDAEASDSSLVEGAIDEAEPEASLSEGGVADEVGDGGSEPAEAESAPVEEPAEGPAEEPAGEPAALPEDAEEAPVPDEPAPAPDGASVTISGTRYATQFSDGAELQLTGDTTLIINRDCSLVRIYGDYALTITVQSGKTLTVNNTDGHAISVSTFRMNGPGTLSLQATKDGLYIDKNIDITEGTLKVYVGASGVHSRNEDISLNCSASVISVTGPAIYAQRGYVTVSGELTANVIDTEEPAIQSGSFEGSRVHLGRITFKDGTFTVNAKTSAIYSVLGDVNISGNLTVTSSNAIGILSPRVTNVDNSPVGTITVDEAVLNVTGATYGMKCGGNIVIMNADITAKGGDYALYAEDGFSMDSRHVFLTPATGQFKGKTVVYSGDEIAKTVVIGLRPVPGSAKMVYPDDVPYVGDTVSLSLTGVPSQHTVQWEISEDGWNFADIPGATGETYTIKPEQKGLKLQARISAYGYGEPVRTPGAFIYERHDPITSTAVTVTGVALGKTGSTTVNKPEGAPYNVTNAKWTMDDAFGDPLTGSWKFEPGHTYYFSFKLTAYTGYAFSKDSTVTLNGVPCTRVGGEYDAAKETYSYVLLRYRRTFPAGIAIDEANFPDYWFRDYVQRSFDDNEDWILSDAERNPVTEIDIDGCSDQSYYWLVTSLEGIEYFPNLQYLYCGSGLKTLDLSQNTKLKEVRLNNDDAGGDLTSLNVKGCTQLESLSLYDNQVTSLDLSTNTSLRALDVDGNSLTSLDLSKNTLLESLGVGNNKSLASLDLSKNTNLRSLRLSGSGISSINLAPLTKLEYLNCENCGMTSLNVSKNTALASLYCGKNSLTTLDVTHNPKLKYLYCEYNKLTGLDTGGCPVLDRLYCIGNRLNGLDLSKNAAMSSLECYGNDITQLTVYSQKLKNAWEGTYHPERTASINGKDVTYIYYSNGGGVLAVDKSVKLSAGTASVLYGDVNNDGNVNPADRAALARYLAKWPDYQDINPANADVNGDGNVNPADRAYLARYFAKWPAYAVLGKPAA